LYNGVAVVVVDPLPFMLAEKLIKFSTEKQRYPFFVIVWQRPKIKDT